MQIDDGTSPTGVEPMRSRAFSNPGKVLICVPPQQGKSMSDVEREIELENMAADEDDFLDGVAPACNLGEACESCQ